MNTSALEKHGPVKTSAVRASTYSPRRSAALAADAPKTTSAPQRAAIGVLMLWLLRRINRVVGSRPQPIHRGLSARPGGRVKGGRGGGGAAARRKSPQAGLARPPGNGHNEQALETLSRPPEGPD